MCRLASITSIKFEYHEAYRRNEKNKLFDREAYDPMDRLLIDFSQVYGQNEPQRATRSVYNTQASPLKDPDKTQETPRISFEDMLSNSIKNVNNLQLEAEKKVRDMALGDVDDISEVVLASSRADTALRLVMEMRNKFLDAYQALSRITG